MDAIYMSGFMQAFLLLIYLPLVVLGLFWLWRRVLPASPWGKLAGTLAYLIAAVLLVLGDVLHTHWQMAWLCPDAGLQVYRSVEVEGFYSEVGLDPRAELTKGYQYVEFAASGNRLGWIRWREDGTVTEGSCSMQEANCKPQSRYWLIGERYQPVSRNVLANAYEIVERQTGEVLGRDKWYTALPGWLDQQLVAMFGPVVWTCGTADTIALRQTVLSPRKTTSKEAP